MVKFFGGETSAVVSSNQSAIGEKPLYIGRTWRRSQVLPDNPQESLLEMVTRCNCFFVLLPKPGSFDYTPTSVELK